MKRAYSEKRLGCSGADLISIPYALHANPYFNGQEGTK